MKNVLICHIMENEKKEIARVKTRTHKQDFVWRKRAWPIAQDAIWVDKKGISHLHINVNEADGTYRFLYSQKNNIVDDKCTQCGGRISIDALNVRSMTSRKVIQSIWGVDQSYIMLLLIMAIVLVMAVGALFYIIGEKNKSDQIIRDFVQKQTLTNMMVIYS